MASHFTKKFQREVMGPVEEALKEAGGITPEVQTLFRDKCLAIGHVERVRNLYRIKHKLSGEAVFFKSNKPQEKVLLDGARRKIILKARQVGFTTLSCVRALDLALWEENTSTGILSHLKNLVLVIFSDLIKYSYRHFIKDWGTFYNPVERSNSSTALEFSDDGLGRTLNSSIHVRHDFRGRTVNFLHFSEAAFIEPERFLSSLQAVPVNGEVILESTPNGLGGVFHSQWVNWEKMGDLAPYKGFWVPWYTIYPERPGDWILPDDVVLTEYEQELLEHPNITEAHIAWRRWCIAANCNGSHEEFDVEYPSNTTDAFMGSGEANVFGGKILKRQKRNVKDPSEKGYLLWDGPRITLHEEDKGYVWIWTPPKAGHQYVIGADPAGGVGKDQAAAYVIDRRTGVMVARIAGQLEPVEFADELIKLGTYYNKAYICVESNNHGIATIERIKQANYGNLYRRKTIDEVTNKTTRKIGFQTTNDQKIRITEAFKTACADGSVTIRDMALIAEMSTFLQFAGKQNRSYVKREAAPGAHDDLVMAACFAVEMNNSLGQLVDEEETFNPYSGGEWDSDTGFVL